MSKLVNNIQEWLDDCTKYGYTLAAVRDQMANESSLTRVAFDQLVLAKQAPDVFEEAARLCLECSYVKVFQDGSGYVCRPGEEGARIPAVAAFNDRSSLAAAVDAFNMRHAKESELQEARAKLAEVTEEAVQLRRRISILASNLGSNLGS